MKKRKPQPVNPYVRLRDDMREFARKVIHPHQTRTMTFDRATVAAGTSYNLRDLLQRVIAADDLGYTTEIRLTPDRVEFWLVKQRPDYPMELT